MRRVAAILAVGLALGASATAWGQGFTNYRQAATDQYAAGSGTGGGAPTPVTALSRRPKTTKAPKTKKHRPAPGAHKTRPKSGRLGTGTGTRSGAAPPVAVPGSSSTEAIGKGQLPYTGGPLGVLVLIALTFMAAGFLLAAVVRLRRARSRDASAS